MADVPDLRALAASYEPKMGRPSRLDEFLDSLDDAHRAAVMDVLVGEPRLGHRVVADLLTDTYPSNDHIARKPVTDNEVLRWRQKNNR